MKKESRIHIAFRLLRLVKSLRFSIVLAVLCGILGALCAAAIPVLGAWGLAAFCTHSEGIHPAGFFVGLVILGILRGLFRYGETVIGSRTAYTGMHILRDRIFATLRTLAPAKLSGREKGNLISLIMADVEQLETFYGHTLVPAVSTAFYALTLSVFMGVFHPVLGLLALTAYGVVGFVIPYVSATCSKETAAKLRQKSGALSGYLLDSLGGLSETLQFGGSAQRLAEMNRQTEPVLKAEKKMRRIEGVSRGVTEACVVFFDLCMVIIAALLYRNGDLDFTGVLITSICLIGSFEPCLEIAALGSRLSKTFASGKRILDLLDETPAAPDIEGAPQVDFHGVQVENVTFLSEGYPVLKNASLEIPENTIVGLTGPSSSGKSTLLKLLMRFSTTDSGSVRISGTSIENINTQDLRNMESLVTQDTYLFKDSILNNLRIAKMDASLEEIQAACKKASVHDFIMGLPMGYDTQVGELGDSLSGGERQRLGLARAFLHGAPFLLLDEPTSNLDSLNEAVILRSLHNQRKDKTVLLVSHRSSALCIADKVYSAERGDIKAYK